MKRDMELVRKIMFKLEELTPSKSGQPVISSGLKIDGHDAEEIVYHCKLIEDDGLVDSVKWDGGPFIHDIGIHRLTAKGCDVLDAVRSDKVWSKVKKTATDKEI